MRRKKQIATTSRMFGICPDCCVDRSVAYPRGLDGTCRHCGRAFCAPHLVEHWKTVHCIAVDLCHCRRDVDGQDEARAALAPSRK